jgi:hypothetical protein
MDLSLTIKSGLAHLAECLGLDAIDVSHDLGNILVETSGHPTAKVGSRHRRRTMAPVFAPVRDQQRAKAQEPGQR